MGLSASYIGDTQKEFLRALYQPYTINFSAFLKKYRTCGKDCEQLCCSIGAYVFPDDIERINSLFDTGDKNVKDLLSTDSTIIDFYPPNPYYQNQYLKNTALKTCVYSGASGSAGEHSQTCVYKQDNGKCGLQAAAIERKEHPWTYKPFDCSLFPIVFTKKPDGYVLSVFFNNGDGLYTGEIWPGYDTHGSCVTPDEHGTPGYVLFEQELIYLSEILGVDILEKIKSHEI